MSESLIPKHVAIIPDGNRRWAKQNGLKPWLGHKRGIDILIEGLAAALEAGVSYVTFWGASIDNLVKRDKIETKFFLSIIRNELSGNTLLDFLHANKVKAVVLGKWREQVRDAEIVRLMENMELETQQYSKTILTILFAYDGKAEMLDAIEQLNESSEQPSDKSVRKYLLTGNLPDVDLVIRTGGQPHWSAGFMMWLTANSEFYFTETLWPDFSKKEFKKALADFALRRRKMGS